MPAFYLEIATVLLGLGLLLADAFAESRNRLFVGVAALFGVAAVFVALFFVERNPGAPTWGIYATDTLALFYKGLALLATILVLVMSLEYAPVLESYRDGPPNKRGLGEFYSLPVLVCAGLMWMASMTDLVGIFVSLETVTITFYILVAYLRQNVGSLEAGVKYLILGRFPPECSFMALPGSLDSPAQRNSNRSASHLPRGTRIPLRLCSAVPSSSSAWPSK